MLGIYPKAKFQSQLLVTLGFAAALAVLGGFQSAAAQDDLDYLFGDETSAAEQSADTVEPDSDADTTATSKAGSSATSDSPDPQPIVLPEQSTPPVNQPARNRLIEEIVVTAQKREENLQDVPISVVALSGDQLDALGVNNAKDLGDVTPGFTANESVGFALYNIRGVGSDVIAPSADASVATYLDGIYQPFPSGLAADFGKLSRIEILKGPQGTLFGRNTTGGAINIITEKPQDQAIGEISASLGDFGRQDIKAFVSGPLFSDSLAGSLSLIRNQSDYINRLLPESVVQDYSSNVNEGLNARLRWFASDTIDITASAVITRIDAPSAQIGSRSEFTPLLQLTNPAVQDPARREASRTSEDFLRNYNDLFYAETNWTPDPLDLKFLISHQEVETNGGYDYDQTERSVAFATTLPQLARITTAELQLSSKPDGWLSGDFEWTMGLYYFTSLAGVNPLNLSLLGAYGGDLLAGVPALVDPPLSTALEAILTPIPLGQLVDMLAAGLPLPLPALSGVTLVSRGLVQTDAIAGYSQGSWRPVDWFGLTLGARVQYEDRGSVLSTVSLDNAGEGTGETTVFNFPNDGRTSTDFSPKVVLDFHPFEDDSLLYLSWQKGTKSGTFNTFNVSAPPSEVLPEEITAYEIGVKGSLLDSTLRYDLAAFHYEIKNRQEQIISIQSSGGVSLFNADEARSHGVDGGILWQALPQWNPGFIITAAASYIDAEYTYFPDGNGFDPNTGLAFGSQVVAELVSPGRDFAGNSLTSSPKFTASVGLNQLLEFERGELELGVNLNYNSGFFFDAQNTAPQPSYSMLDARISYLYRPWNLRATLQGKNLTDAVFYRFRFRDDFGLASQYGQPRAVMGSLKWEFGH